jgi:hypothetical protein
VEVVVVEAEVVDRPMAKVAPKKTTAKQKIKREQEHIKRTFNACVKERKKKKLLRKSRFSFCFKINAKTGFKKKDNLRQIKQEHPASNFCT